MTNQTQLDARCEQQLQATTAAIARVAIATTHKLHVFMESLGFTFGESFALIPGIAPEHEAIAAGIIADAFQPDMIHEIMARFGGFDATNEADDENFRTIKNELKEIGHVD